MTDTVAAPTETASRAGAGESSAGPAVPDHLTPGKFEDPPSSRLEAFMADTRPDVKIFEKGKAKRADIEATQSVDIVEFVDLDEIDPMFFDRPYYLEPDKKGAKAYSGSYRQGRRGADCRAQAGGARE